MWILEQLSSRNSNVSAKFCPKTSPTTLGLAMLGHLAMASAEVEGPRAERRARDWELFSKTSSQLRLVELGKQHNTTAQFLKLSATTRAVHLTSTVQHIMLL
jgi:hypothetical protein